VLAHQDVRDPSCVTTEDPVFTGRSVPNPMQGEDRLMVSVITPHPVVALRTLPSLQDMLRAFFDE
jgi:hypothetical protein